MGLHIAWAVLDGIIVICLLVALPAFSWPAKLILLDIAPLTVAGIHFILAVFVAAQTNRMLRTAPVTAASGAPGGAQESVYCTPGFPAQQVPSR
jgi:hypothetical protein